MASKLGFWLRLSRRPKLLVLSTADSENRTLGAGDGDNLLRRFGLFFVGQSFKAYACR
jgi:hypothetical protein